MASTLEEDSFQKHFRNYNYHAYAITLYQQWIQEKSYRSYESTPDDLIPFFQDYIQKLAFKAQIDIIFHRKAEIQKNKEAFEKLLKIITQLNLGPNLDVTTQQLIRDPFDYAATSDLADFVERVIQNPELYGGSELSTPSLTPTSLAITQSIQSGISYTNSHRLDLVWSRNLIDTLVGLSSRAFIGIRSISNDVALINGVSSYGFYFLRGGLDVAKLFRHGVITQHPHLTKKQITTLDKLRLQWGLRYASIINDIILWGPVNLVTFHYLYGMGVLGYFGNVLTAGLLFCDFSLNLYNLIHTKNKFAALEQQLTNSGISQKIIAELRKHHQKQLTHLKWYVYYSAALCLAFIALCTFLIPGEGLSVLLMPHTLLFGSVLILGLQILINLKDSIIKFQDATCAEMKKIAMVEGAVRFFIQAAIPSLLIFSSLFVSPSGISAWFLTIAALAISAMLIRVLNQLTRLFSLNQEIKMLEARALQYGENNRNLTVHEQEDLQETIAAANEKKQAVSHTRHLLFRDLYGCAGGTSVLASIGMGLTLGSTNLAPLLAIPIFLSLLSFILFSLKDYQSTPKKDRQLALESLAM